MKKSMIFLLSLTITAICLTALLSFTEDTARKYALMRITEHAGGVWDRKITVTYEDNSKETFELDKLSAKDHHLTAVSINKAINDIASKGYQLISTNSSTNGGLLITNLYFVRE